MSQGAGNDGMGGSGRLGENDDMGGADDEDYEDDD